MTLGPPTRLTCPHCGKSKYILSIASGNTFGATHWSDTKHDYPMLRHPSLVQRCPHCDGYFFYEDSKPVDCNPDALSEKHSLTDWDAEWSGDAGNATISEKKDRKRYWERWEKANANGFGDLTFGETDAAFDGLYASADKTRQQMLLFMWLYSLMTPSVEDRWGLRLIARRLFLSGASSLSKNCARESKGPTCCLLSSIARWVTLRRAFESLKYLHRM